MLGEPAGSTESFAEVDPSLSFSSLSRAIAGAVQAPGVSLFGAEGAVWKSQGLGRTHLLSGKRAALKGLMHFRWPGDPDRAPVMYPAERLKSTFGLGRLCRNRRPDLSIRQARFKGQLRFPRLRKQIPPSPPKKKALRGNRKLRRIKAHLGPEFCLLSGKNKNQVQLCLGNFLLCVCVPKNKKESGLASPIGGKRQVGFNISCRNALSLAACICKLDYTM